MHAILHSFTYPLKPLTQASISIQPIPILYATHNHALPNPDVSHPEFCPANVLPYLGISHPKFFSADIPPGYSQPPFCPANIPPSPDVSQPPFCPANILPYPDVSHPDLKVNFFPPRGLKHVHLCMAAFPKSNCVNVFSDSGYFKIISNHQSFLSFILSIFL